MGCGRCGKRSTEANAARARRLAERAAEKKALAEQIAKQNERLRQQRQQQQQVVITESIEQVQPDAAEPEASTEQPSAPDSSSELVVEDAISQQAETEGE
jgi:hypothetical protein